MVVLGALMHEHPAKSHLRVQLGSMIFADQWSFADCAAVPHMHVAPAFWHASRRSLRVAGTACMPAGGISCTVPAGQVPRGRGPAQLHGGADAPADAGGGGGAAAAEGATARAAGGYGAPDRIGRGVRVTPQGVHGRKAAQFSAYPCEGRRQRRETCLEVPVPWRSHRQRGAAWFAAGAASNEYVCEAAAPGLQWHHFPCLLVAIAPGEVLSRRWTRECCGGGASMGQGVVGVPAAGLDLLGAALQEEGMLPNHRCQSHLSFRREERSVHCRLDW